MQYEKKQHMSNGYSQSICILFMQRRLNVFDVGPAVYKCYTNVLCLLNEAGTLSIGVLSFNTAHPNEHRLYIALFLTALSCILAVSEPT